MLDVTATSNMTDHNKLKIVLEGWMLGKGYHQALRARSMAAKIHVGLRKDGVTPEIAHMDSIAGYLQTIIPSLLYPDETLCVAYLHDCREDYDVSDAEIRVPFGDRVADGVEAMSKVINGVKKDERKVFADIARSPVASIVKPGDRIHNFQSMVGVFTLPKQKEYLLEGETFFLPMIKEARGYFPEQRLAYQNARHILLSQIALIKAIHRAAEAA